MVLVDASSVSPSIAIVWASLIVPCLQGCSWPWQAVAGMHVVLRVGQELQRLKIFCSLDFARLTGATPQSLTTALLFVSDQEVSMSPNFESYAQCLHTFWIPPLQVAPRTPPTSSDARRRPPSRSCMHRLLLSGTLLCAFGRCSCRNRRWTQCSYHVPLTMRRMAYSTRLMWTPTMRDRGGGLRPGCYRLCSYAACRRP